MDILNLRRNVALVVKNAPDFIVEEALVDATRQLCLESEIWQVMTDIDVSNGDNEIAISAPSGASVVRVMWATLSDRKLQAVDPATYSTLFTDTSVSLPEYYYQQDATTLVVFPSPSDSENGQARIVCALKEGFTNLPDDLYYLYREAIIFGAMSRVLATPSDFGNPQLANYYAQLWTAALDRARGRATRSRDNTVFVAAYGGY
jgi:hypothetical protein